jgi:hypothetical protein
LVIFSGWAEIRLHQVQITPFGLGAAEFRGGTMPPDKG